MPGVLPDHNPRNQSPLYAPGPHTLNPKPPPRISDMAHTSPTAVTLASDDGDHSAAAGTGTGTGTGTDAPSRLNARAPEFVPRNANYQHHRHPHTRAVAVAPVHFFPAAPAADDREAGPAEEGLPEEAVQKVVNQVEYYLSDVNLATTDHLMRFINKDPEGFVPISVIAAFKKIKALVHSHALLADALRTSSKLIVSDDGKKIRRQQPFTDTDLEELQSRIIVAENLPEDHSHQKLMKIFSSIGSVKSIRTCPAQPGNNATSAASRAGKMEMLFSSNKLHAFVEYETVELAEKAVTELNDERNWRSGLRVRLLHKCMTKPARGRRGQDGDWNGEEEDASTTEPPIDKHQQDDSQALESSLDQTGEENFNEREGGGRRGGRGRGRGKGHRRGQHHNSRGGHSIGTPPSSNHIHNDQQAMLKLPPGPRMPDGTRGFTMGRGKPPQTATASVPSSSPT